MRCACVPLSARSNFFPSTGWAAACEHFTKGHHVVAPHMSVSTYVCVRLGNIVCRHPLLQSVLLTSCSAMPLAIPLPPPCEIRSCGYCDEVPCGRRVSKCSGCGCMTYCSRVCLYHDWERHKHQCVFWRVREWQRRLLLDGTPLPDCHVRLILSYALAPPLFRLEHVAWCR